MGWFSSVKKSFNRSVRHYKKRIKNSSLVKAIKRSTRHYGERINRGVNYWVTKFKKGWKHNLSKISEAFTLDDVGGVNTEGLNNGILTLSVRFSKASYSDVCTNTVDLNDMVEATNVELEKLKSKVKVEYVADYNSSNKIDRLVIFSAFDTNNKVYFITFQGTKQLSHYSENLKGATGRMHGREFYQGFLDGYLTFQSVISDFVGGLSLSNNDVICFTGHSRGGSLATLASYDMVKTYPKFAKHLQVYTYGSPKVGKYSSWPDVYDKLIPKSFRILQPADPVPHYPSTIIGDYYHCGKPLFLTNDTYIKFANSPIINAVSFVNDLIDMASLGILMLDDMQSHSIDKYIESTALVDANTV